MADRPPRILLVDDEESIRTLLSYPLRKDGYEVITAVDGKEALDRFRETTFDLVVLDVMMPVLDGLEVCRVLRARSTVPIIMLTAKTEEVDKIVGLELGADDYITKPFSVREFRSRVKASLRRASMVRDESPDGQAPLEVRELRIEPARRAVRVRGDEVALTFVEFEILAALAGSPGRVWTREQLLTRVWGDSAYRDPRTVDVHIRHLREKLERRRAPAGVPLHRPRGRLPLPRRGRRLSPRARRSRAMRSLANRLALIFFLITLGAMTIVYVGVVPNLESSLVSDRSDRLERAAGRTTPPIARAIDSNAPGGRGRPARALRPPTRRTPA